MTGGAVAELGRALGCLLDLPSSAHGPVAAATGLGEAPTVEAHTAVLVLQCPPHAALYLGDRGMLGGDAADRVAGFWAAIGVPAPAGCDHAARLMALNAALAERERTAAGPAARAAARARGALVREHLSSWLPVWFAALADTGDPWFGAWAERAGSWLAAELGALGGSGGLAATEPAALADAGPGLEGAGGVDELVDALASPVRCGMVLSTSRLREAARSAGMAVRVGERRFVLRSLLEQDTAGTLRWVSGEARRWEGRFARWAHVDPVVGSWWQARARRTSLTLDAVGAAA